MTLPIAAEAAQNPLLPNWDEFIIGTVVFLIVFAAAGITLPAANLLMVPVTAALPAVLATVFASARFPNRVRQDLESLHRCVRIVALNDQFTRSRALFRRFVPDHHIQARTGV